MKFLVYGAGALGQALGCMLAAADHQVDLLLRQRFLTAIAKDGLKVNGIFGDFSVAPDRLGLMTELASPAPTYDYILITTKAYDTARAAADLDSHCIDCNRIVSMQNGCGNIELLSHCFGPQRCYGARVITGFAITRPGEIAITVSADAIHIGASHPGAIPPGAQELATLLDQAGHPALAVSDIHRSLYAKLLYNSTLNPLGAVLGVHYGALGENEESRAIMDLVIEETFTVIQALGGTTPWSDAAGYRREFYDRLLPATYNHRSSMLQDLENGKQTEIGALTGYVSSKGRELHCPTPTCDLLNRLVRFKEAAATVGTVPPTR